MKTHPAGATNGRRGLVRKTRFVAVIAMKWWGLQNSGLKPTTSKPFKKRKKDADQRSRYSSGDLSMYEVWLRCLPCRQTRHWQLQAVPNDDGLSKGCEVAPLPD